jgi:hypothetical protein
VFLNKSGNGIRDSHSIPDTDTHRSAFLGVYRLTAEIFLIETKIEHGAITQPVDDEGVGAKNNRENVESGFIREHR